MPWRALPYSWSWVSGGGDGIKDMETLFAGECGSYLYWPQEFEVYLYLAISEYEAKEMAWVGQGLFVRSALSPGKGKCGCRRVEPQGPL
jgi:hypothetical protein